MNTAHRIVLLIVTSLTLTAVDALRCYTCSSLHSDQEWCGVNFKPTLVEAPQPCQGNCYKFQGEFYDRGARKVFVSRGCIEQSPACQQQTHQGYAGYMCVCNKEYCNAASHPSPSFLLLAPLALLLLLRLL